MSEGDPIPPSEAALLVVTPNWVGDVVMGLPVLDALAGAGRRLLVLARPHLCPLLDLSPAVAATIPRPPTTAETIRALADSGASEAVLLPNSFRSAWLARQAGIPVRWGYRGDFRRPLLAPSVPRPSRSRHQTEDYGELLAAMGVALPPRWTPTLALTPSRLERGRDRLARAGLDPHSGPLVALFPGAEFGPSKRWPVSRFAELGRELRRARPDLRLLIVAGPKEVWLAVRLHEDTARIAPVVGPELDLADLAAVLAHCHLLVTNDSGPMHLAAALGVRCVALFGPTDPRRTAPAGDGHSVVSLDRWCAPCFRRRCPLLHQRCLRDIGAEEVLAKALDGLPPA